MAYSIDKTKSKIAEIKQKLESKKSEMANLEYKKRELIEAGMEVQGSKLDEHTQGTLMDSISQSLDANAKRGQELSKEMGENLKNLEEHRQETQESIESNQKTMASMERKKAALDKFGLGSAMDKGLSALQENRKDLAEVEKELADTQKSIFDLSAKASML